MLACKTISMAWTHQLDRSRPLCCASNCLMLRPPKVSNFFFLMKAPYHSSYELKGWATTFFWFPAWRNLNLFRSGDIIWRGKKNNVKQTWWSSLLHVVVFLLQILRQWASCALASRSPGSRIWLSIYIRRPIIVSLVDSLVDFNDVTAEARAEVLFQIVKRLPLWQTNLCLEFFPWVFYPGNHR